MNSSTSSHTPSCLSWFPLVTLSLAFFVGACGPTEHRSLSDEQVVTARQPLSCGAGGSGGESTVDDKAPGALIVDLGSLPQTQGNALKPYGLVYDLVKNLKVPVLWAYNQSKTANTDVDFTADGRSFRGSSFVIPGAFVATAQATVNRWVAQGVVVYGPTQSAFTPPTYFKRITGFPNIVLDPQNGAIAQTYLTAAGFPTFPVQYPTSLNVCQDMFVLPHADPTWANHGNLKSFVSNGGFLWVGCHAVSILEELDGNGDSAPDMNFLSSIGLINYANHVNAYPPYNYDSTSVADPIMQFLGKVDSAVSGGSEAVYLPYRGGAWRPTTKVSIWDPDQADVTTGKSPGLAAKLAYGRGYGLASSGVVMYQGSHNFSGTSADQIASQRAFLNLVLWNASEKSVVVRASVPTRMFGSTGVNLTSTASSSGTIASYQWTSSCGGTFGTPTEANTTFTSPPAAIQNTPCVIRLTATDSCGRVAFDARDTTILGLPDLAVTVTPSSLTPSVGSNLDYTITANNVGGLSTVNSNVTFTLPPASQYTVTSVTTSPAGIACATRAAPNTNVYDCALGDLDGCNPVSIVVHGTATGAGCFGVDVTGTTTSNDIDLGSNTANTQGCVTTTGNNPVLIKRVSPASPTTVNPGGTLSYTLTLLNAGGTKLDNIHIYDPYPATTTTYVTGSTSVTYRSYTAAIADSFAGNNYTGSTGQQPWAGPWTEINDGNGRPNRGRIRVRTSNCASTSCPNITAAVEGLGLQRPLSLLGASGATLSFSYRVPTAKSGQTAVVQVSGDGGTTWRTLGTISLGTQVNTSTPVSYPLQANELTGNARLRFTTTGTSSAVFAPDDISMLLQIEGTTRTSAGSAPIAGNSWDLTQNLDGQLSLKPGESMTVTFRASVNTGVAGGTLISNTANVKTTQTSATAFNSNTVSVSTAASATSAPVAATQTVALLEDVLGGNLGITAPTDADTAQTNLTVTVKRLPRSSQAVIYLADGVTPISTNQSLTVAQLTSLRVNGAPDFNGTADEFNYVVTDPQGNSSTGVATITLTAVNDAPVAYPDQASTQKGVTLVLDPPGTNDTDVDGFIDDALCDLDPLTAGLQSVFINAAGTWTVDTDTGSANFGSVTFVPAASFTGTAAIRYSIGDDGTPLPSVSSAAGSNCSTTPTGGCITVRVNAPPVAVADTFTVSPIGGDLDVAANDSDSDGLIDVSALDLDPSTAGIQTTYLVTGKGTFTSLLNGRVHFAPISGVFGGVSINYTIDDFDGGTSNSVALSVTVNGCSGAADCNDGNDCTSDACNAGVCVNANLSTTASCNDRNPGTKDDRCDGAGVCAGTVYACAPGPCESASVPNGSGCIGTPKVDGTACDDGSACTQTDSCQTGVCTGGNPVVCGGGDDCHDPGICSPATGLCSVPAAKADGTSCNDADACTQTDTCQGGACTGSNPITCTAIDQCHDAGTCSPATGTCSTPNKADGTSCTDGNACTQTDTCQSGACTGNNPVICAAVDQCHDAGTCSPATGTCSSPSKTNGTTCNDGDACTQTDTCQSGACTGSNPITCTAIDQCHDAGTCSPATGTCSAPNKTDGAGCNDGNACTQTDTCQSGACTGSNPVVCAAVDQCHDAGTCSPATGACSTPNKTNGTTCNDGNLCTQTDTCESGVCTGSNPVVCAAADQCHDAGTCAPATGACSTPNKADDTQCNDGNACTQTDTCQNGACTGNNPVVCAAVDQCHDAGTCSPATGICSTPNKNDGAGCNDGDQCTQTDSCQAGVCTGANPLLCSDPEKPSCDNSTGQCGCNLSTDCLAIAPVCDPTQHTCHGCLVDGDCKSTQFCNTESRLCVAKVANGAAIPTILGHTPNLAGQCNDTVAVAVCVSGVCDVTDHRCGYLNNDGPCTSSNGSVVCRSGVCDSADSKCGYADGDGPCTSGNAATSCRSGVCSTGGLCLPPSSCLADADCASTQFCNTQTNVCTAKLANETAIPTLTGHAPPLDGQCSLAVALAVCLSSVCNDRDDLCGYPNGDGPCTTENASTVCRSAICDSADAKCGLANGDGPCTSLNAATVCRSKACSVSGVCQAEGTCTVDGDCASTQFCNSESAQCTPKLPNGAPLPTLANHAPNLNGSCSDAVGAAVCISAVCDVTDNQCGIANGDGPCLESNAPVVCRSKVCDAKDSKCGYADGDGPCTKANASVTCRSGACSVSGVCQAPSTCTVDGDCDASQFCNTESKLCMPKFVNGTPIPKVAGHSPALTGDCTVAAGSVACSGGVCDETDDRCGYANGNGTCTPGIAGTVCRTGACDEIDGKCGYLDGSGPCMTGGVCRSGACSVSGVCHAAGSCTVDADCSATQYCNSVASTCQPKLPNGTSLPVLAGHVPALDGVCAPSQAAIVCTSSVCDAADNACGYSNGVGPCTVENAPVVCRSSACDAGDLKCGYADGNGPCTAADASSVCRSGACSVSGVCQAAGACTVDADCTASQFCDTGLHGCKPKLANGAPLPTISGHIPVLDGVCSAPVSTVVCLSSVCDVSDNRCGLVNGEGPCSSTSGAVMCRSSVCSASDSKCGYAEGEGPCTSLDASAVCRSARCSAEGVCVAANGCRGDADCDSEQFCNTATNLCTPRLPNGVELPNIAGHMPALNGICSSAVGLAVCQSRICDVADNRCGLRDASAPCSSASAGICRSGVCTNGVCGVPSTGTGGSSGATGGTSGNLGVGGSAVGGAANGTSTAIAGYTGTTTSAIDGTVGGATSTSDTSGAPKWVQGDDLAGGGCACDVPHRSGSWPASVLFLTTVAWMLRSRRSTKRQAGC